MTRFRAAARPASVCVLSFSVVFVLLAGAMFVSFGLPACERWLATADEQGWFTAASYKPRQGFWVRRGTMVDCKLIPIDPLGRELLTAPISLWVDRSAKRPPRRESNGRSLFDARAERAPCG